jgi:hypothetical protein
MAWAARLDRVVAQLPAHTSAKAPKLQWIPASVRNAIQSIPAEEVLFFISDEKHAHVQTASG